MTIAKGSAQYHHGVGNDVEARAIAGKEEGRTKANSRDSSSNVNATSKRRLANDNFDHF